MRRPISNFLCSEKEGIQTGISFFDFLRPKASGPGQLVEISCRELLEAEQEYQIRELSFWTCVNMVANALGRCEFRTFENGVEVRDRDYYLWNVEPNVNQNSSAFLHKLAATLYRNNEALVVNPRKRDGADTLVVADSWTVPELSVTRMQEYRDVTVDGYTFRRSFREDEVLHLQLNHVNMKPIIDGLYQSWWRMVSAAMKLYQWDNGQHWKVHVDHIAGGREGFTEDFMRMIQEQVKPFLEANGAILPEFDGYTYTNVGGTGKTDSRDIKSMVEDIFEFTARGFLMPAVLVNGKVEATGDANGRFLTNCLDPICDQLQEEANRKIYGFEGWKAGNYLMVDTSGVMHFDLFAAAAGVEKLVGSGAFTINDILRAAGQATINEPWANQHYMTKNIGTVQALTDALEAQKGGTT